MKTDQILANAENQLFEKEYEEVIRLAEALLADQPQNTQAAYLRARAQLEMGEGKDAEILHAFSSYIGQHPNDWNAYYWRYVAHDHFGKHFGGTKPPPGFKTTLGQGPPYREERMRAAIADITKAIELAPEREKLTLRRNRAVAMSHIGHEDAQAELELVLREVPGDRGLTILLERIKRSKEASGSAR